MSEPEIFDVLYVTLFALISVGILVVLFTLWRFIRPSARNDRKELPYECGMDQVTGPWGRFHVRYYYFGLLFVLFDVETVLLFAAATRFRGMRADWVAPSVTVGLFITLVLLALIYAWRKGVLEWR